MATQENKVRMKVLARLHAQQKARDKELEEQQRDFRCQICGRSFSCAKALGGHKNAHRRDQEDAMKEAARAPALLNGYICMYFYGPVHGYSPQAPGGGLSASSSSSSGITAADSRAQLFPTEYPSSRPEEEADDDVDLSLRL